MPLPGTHTARQIPPSQCERIRSQPDAFGPGIGVLWCVKSGKAEIGSVHFDSAKFTVEQAKAWLKRHDLSTKDFEPATPSKQNAAAALEMEAARPELLCGGRGIFLLEAADAANPATLPRVRMTAYTGVPMKLEGFPYPVVLDLESLRVPRQQVPLLRAHDPGRIAGHSTAVDVSPQRVHAAGVLSGMPEHVDDLVQTAGRGFPWAVSVGAASPPKLQYVPEGESVKVNGRNWEGPVQVARGATLREMSLLPLGADGNTTAAVEAVLAEIMKEE